MLSKCEAISSGWAKNVKECSNAGSLFIVKGKITDIHANLCWKHYKLLAKHYNLILVQSEPQNDNNRK
jgi:hypothetical protein